MYVMKDYAINRDTSSKLLSTFNPLRRSTVSRHYWIPQCDCRMWAYFYSCCIFFESKSILIFLVDPVTESHKGLKWNTTQQARTITETIAEVFGVIVKGLVTSSLFPQDTLLNCTSDPVSTTVCIWFWGFCLFWGFFVGFFFLNVSNFLFFFLMSSN